MRKVALIFALWLILTPSARAELPEGYWGNDRSQPILDTIMRVNLDPPLNQLSGGEKQALRELIAAGQIMQDLYEHQLHAEALSARAALFKLHDSRIAPAATRNLIDLYYLNKGPIATTLHNERLPFLPVAIHDPGKNVYAAQLTRDEIDAYLATHPEAAAELLSERSVVRRATEENIATDLTSLDKAPAVETLHPGLREYLEQLQYDATGLYAIPYALAYAPELRAARNHLDRAAAMVAADSPDFADYLRNRSRDLLSGDYESGDASWIAGSFGNLNLQFGSYETYNDALYGVKAFYGASILLRDAEKSAALSAALGELQAIEDSLPYAHQKRVRTQIPVGVYNVIADFGQARGANTATILPNDADHTRKYGRTVLIRNNILTNPVIFENRKKRYDSVVGPEYRTHLTLDGGFNRTLWHEIGHYLGVSETADGQLLDAALADHSDLFEEMKADLVSLFAAPMLERAGYHSEASLRAHYADGIRRTLQIVRPRPEQPYQTMQLMQFNFFVEFGLIEPQGESALLAINYDRYHDAVTELLAEVLQIQYAGDYQLASEFVTRWSYWDEKLHGQLAQRMQDSASFRSTLVRYEVLESERTEP